MSASVVSICVFQNRRLSGRPSRSRGPGSSSRKKSASCASNDRSPLGTILTGADRSRTAPEWRCRRRRGRGRLGPRRSAARGNDRSGRAGVGLEEVPQVVGQVAGRGVPLRRPLGQRLQADPLQLPGDRVVDLAGRARLGAAI